MNIFQKLQVKNVGQKESAYGYLYNLIQPHEWVVELAFMKALLVMEFLKYCTNIITFHMVVKYVLF